LTSLLDAVSLVREAQQQTNRPLAIIVAGHNGSGKSTMWRRDLSGVLQMPLVNADRLALSIFPEPDDEGFLPDWAAAMRDADPAWLRVTQQGVTSFIGHAMAAKVPFGMETVFSHEAVRPDGTTESKIDLIRDMQRAGYFVMLFFVGLTNANLSVVRVQTRVLQGGHGIPEARLRQRFPRTQRIIREASSVADATIMADNSRDQRQAFTVCRVQLRSRELFDLRKSPAGAPAVIRNWMDAVAPLEPAEA
jgi:predicted ABC-type ATPase